jgi:hypothetical protein
MKNPWFLAILNFVTIGLGTVLLGKRTTHGLLLFLGASLLRYEELRIAPSITGVFSIHWAVMTTGLALAGLATAREVYAEAKQPT